MYKKIVLILSSLIILSLPFQQQYVEGAILSKVASKGAQKIVKEVIKESAFDIAVNIFIDEAYTMALEERQKYQAQQDYELFCGKKMPDLITCEKPMQAKKVLTAADKVNIGNQAEIELDKLITNGKGFTRWQKFLDWFLPIWVASFALTAITYAIDPEVRSLFNEAGYNALVALGLIKEVGTYDSITALPDQELPPTTMEDETKSGDFTSDVTKYYGGPGAFSVTGLNASNKDLIIQAFYNSGSPVTGTTTMTSAPDTYQLSANGEFVYNFSQTAKHFIFNKLIFGNITSVVAVSNNGTPQTLVSSVPGSGNLDHVRYANTPEMNSTHTGRFKLHQFRTPFFMNGIYYTDIHMQTESTSLTIQVQHDAYNISSPVTSVTGNVTHSTNAGREVKFTVYENKSPLGKVIVPTYEEVQPLIDSTPKTKYENDSGQIALIPPSALPYTQTSTGIQLTPETDPNTGEQKFTTPTGESVPEDDITVGEPNIQENPSPSPNTVTPPATQTNPNPEPIPLTPTTPPKTPTPIETEAPVFPEGESCSEGLKFPKFKQLGSTVANGFPFSLPFDLYDGFNNVFADIGTEKPEFEYKFKFMGDEQIWNIALPDYFDSWKRFTDILLVVFFDITLLYLFNRFFGAMGSD